VSPRVVGVVKPWVGATVLLTYAGETLAALVTGLCRDGTDECVMLTAFPPDHGPEGGTEDRDEEDISPEVLRAYHVKHDEAGADVTWRWPTPILPPG
jgi:hypothetical protein